MRRIIKYIEFTQKISKGKNSMLQEIVDVTELVTSKIYTQDEFNEMERVYIKINEIILDCLIRCDGFDTLAGKFQPKKWIEYSERLIELAEINTNDSVFEIGCGSGILLNLLSLNFKNINF